MELAPCFFFQKEIKKREKETTVPPVLGLSSIYYSMFNVCVSFTETNLIVFVFLEYYVEKVLLT